MPSKGWAKERLAFDEMLKRLDIKEVSIPSCVGMGWIPILEEAFSEMVSLGWDKHLVQAKQKFGGLVIYIDKSNEEIDKAIKRAAEKASTACEDCGGLHGLTIPCSGLALCKTCKDLYYLSMKS